MELSEKDKREIATGFIKSFFTMGALTEEDLQLPFDEFGKKVLKIADASDLRVGVD
jgi:hypothetical protein